MSDDNSLPEPTFSFDLIQYFAERLESARRLAPTVAAQLKAAGVARLIVTYDGSYDSGQIEEINAFDADNNEVVLSSEMSINKTELENLFYDLLEARHPGWENNDGAFGEFTWSLTTEELAHVHKGRITDYETTEHQGI